ncbi:MAG: CBS domain-containing protein [Alphaproteobacteria bacterium]|nr:MAG: CBS domain-containing protein [Alphaproteobacteria bacterium]
MIDKIKKISTQIRGIIAKKGAESSARQTIGEIIASPNSDKDPSLEPEEIILMKNILRLRDQTAEDIMTPRVDIKGIDVNISYDALAELVSKAKFARFPVYSESMDNILGCLHVKDVAGVKKEDFSCRGLLSQVLFIPTSMGLLELLIRMKTARVTMAFVVDEFGGIDGLVTSWDIIREMLGDIDEINASEVVHAISRLSDNTLIVDGRFELEDLQEAIHGVLTKEEIRDYDTVGGLVMHMAGRVPSVHEIFDHPSGTQFEVMDTDGRRVKQVRIYPYKK